MSIFKIDVKQGTDGHYYILEIGGPNCGSIEKIENTMLRLLQSERINPRQRPVTVLYPRDLGFEIKSGLLHITSSPQGTAKVKLNSNAAFLKTNFKNYKNFNIILHELFYLDRFEMKF